MAGVARAYYVTSLDRIGLAIGAGGALSGVIVAALIAAGGQASVGALTLGWLLGAIFAMIGTVAVVGPVWLMLHIANRRGPAPAAATGGLLALLVFTAAQTWSFGPGAPSGDSADFAYRLLSALGTSVVIALASAAIGWTMHRIAYRRIF